MKNFVKNESGDSYTWLALCVVVIVIIGVYLITTLVMSDIIGAYDKLIDKDMVTQDNLDCFNFNIGLFNALPVIMILGLSVWAIVYTLKSKGDT